MEKLKIIYQKFYCLLVLFICFSSFSFANDSLKVSSTNLDTVNNLIINDTLNINAHFIKEEGNFFTRNEGTILGALLAALVSLFSIWITNKSRNRKDERDKAFQINLENQKINRQKMIKENIYCGLLHSIYHELNSHKNLSDINWKSLNLVKDLTLEKDDFVIEKAINIFSTEFINQCRLKILEFESYNTDLLPIISQYISKVISINNYMDFKTVLSSNKKLEMPFVDTVNEYFDILKSDFDEIAVGRQKIQDFIINEIKKYPQNEITNI